mmetsp:Transcript_31968/g.63373  ORF Transcript_31968/g.63373 Transcript_31968/m.63373 type:complete len:100 (+) Transcript_31968:331-630(+)
MLGGVSCPRVVWLEPQCCHIHQATQPALHVVVFFDGKKDKQEEEKKKRQAKRPFRASSRERSPQINFRSLNGHGTCVWMDVCSRQWTHAAADCIMVEIA